METATALTAIQETETEIATALTAIQETAIALAIEIITQTVIPVAIAMETMVIPVTVSLATKVKTAENKKNSKKTTLQQIKDMV